MALCSSSSQKTWIVHGILAGTAIAAAIGAHAYLGRSRKFRSRVVGIIPARYASSRFEGKPLVQILGKPMIQRTWERSKLASTLDHVVVATDDERIADCCRGFGADVIMTSESCRNGTERCNEALEKLEKEYDVVVNIQGDEPLIEPEIIDGVVKALQVAPDAVFNNRGYAIYFSRGLIPYNKSGGVNLDFPYMLHLGIQSFDSKFLKVYSELQPTPLQLKEDLEQLKVLENGYKMKVIKVDHEAHGVDTPEDVEKIESFNAVGMCSESDALIKTYVPSPRSDELIGSVNLKDYRGSFKFYTVDVINGQFIADQYSVRDLPTTTIFKDGEKYSFFHWTSFSEEIERIRRAIPVTLWTCLESLYLCLTVMCLLSYYFFFVDFLLLISQIFFFILKFFKH
ncbi:hypothetical protein Bca52824_081494 [Brassica carinata]|uniref:Uncharacterized protein n=1 Tax=Brassica carinata TaxID=52824 RepID=A0A8X7PIM5_BRACI|nr:hypothetical protein Bca52824_081494 [Brassica carinata]